MPVEERLFMTHYPSPNSTQTETPPSTWASSDEKLRYELKCKRSIFRQQSLETVRKERQEIPDLLTYARLTVAVWQINLALKCADEY